jgi:ABC-type transporter Mla MlaB component
MVKLDIRGDQAAVWLHPDRAGLALVGEIDRHNGFLLTGALRALDADVGDAHLDLSGLTFLDVAGMAELVSFAARRRPGAVVLDGAPEIVRRVIDLIWPENYLEIR